MMVYQLHEKHGKHIAYNPEEVKNNEKNGWRTVSESEFYGRKPKTVSPEISAQIASIEEQYERKYGKKPHHKMKRETIEAALRGDGS